MSRRCSAGVRSFRPGAFRCEGDVGDMLSFVSEPSVASTARTAGITEDAPLTRLEMEVSLSGQAGYVPGAAGGMRVLVAFGDEYRAYREAIARAIQSLRPSTQVTITPLEAVPAQVFRLEPHVVICARRSDGVSDRNTTWVTVPTEAGAPSSISCGGTFREVGELSLTELLTVLDTTAGSQTTLRDEEQPARS